MGRVLPNKPTPSLRQRLKDSSGPTDAVPKEKAGVVRNILFDESEERAQFEKAQKAWGIDYLNAKVERMVAAARSSAGEGNELELWKQIVETENTEVYEYRPRVVLGCYFGVAVFHLLCSAGHLSWFDLGLCALCRFVVMDLYSGILHIVLDSEEFLSWRLPGFWKGALEFHWHHEIPQDLASKPFVEVVGDLIGVMTAFAICTHLIYGSLGLITHHMAFSFGVNFLLAIWLQLGHRMSHTRPAARPGWVKVCQKLQILLPPSDHQKHHQTYDRNFCICHGHCNGFLNYVTQNLIGLDQVKFWFAAWIFMTLVEPWLSSRALVAALGHEVADVTCSYADMGACLTKHFQ